MPRWRLHYHLIWATKGREPIIGERAEETIRRTVSGTSSRMGLIVHAIGVMPEHVHVVVSIPPKYSVAEVVRAMKGSATRYINLQSQNGLNPFRWQAEYGALSFSDRGLADVIDYAVRQRERHASNDLYAALEASGESEDARSAPPGTKGPG